MGHQPVGVGRDVRARGGLGVNTARIDAALAYAESALTQTTYHDNTAMADFVEFMLIFCIVTLGLIAFALWCGARKEK